MSAPTALDRMISVARALAAMPALRRAYIALDAMRWEGGEERTSDLTATFDDGDRLLLVRRPEVHPVTALILGPGYRPMRVTELYATDGPVLHEPTLLEIDALEMRREQQARARRRGDDKERPPEPPEPPEPPDGAHAAA